MFGCHILVINCILGGSKGYCFGMRISTSKTPPSYGVPSGPLMVPTRCRHPGQDGTRRSSGAVRAITPDVESGLHIAVISLAILPADADIVHESTERQTNYRVGPTKTINNRCVNVSFG